MDTQPQSTAQLESMARASLQPGFVPPKEETKSEPVNDAPEVETQETPTDESVTEQTPSEKQQAKNSETEAEETAEPEKPKEEEQPKDEKKESDYLKKLKEEKRVKEGFGKLNSEKDAFKTEVAQVRTQLQAREQRIQQIVSQLESLAQDDGKLPDYRAPDGKMYPAEVLARYVGDSFAAGEEEQGRQALLEYGRLNMQKGNAMGLAPTKSQWENAEKKLALLRAERPEYRAESGTDHDRLAKQFLSSGPLMNLLAREPDGIDALRTWVDMAAAGFKVPKLEARIAELEKLDGEKSKAVAHYEKATSPQKAGIARKPAPEKPIGDLSKADLERKAREVFANAGFR